MIQMFVAIISI